ncbi:alpha/beta fold hydrolase [Microlunatus parietis]|uniref:Pimeloyl-ACP methyl ester carboxylesterase n=1 Tax=Microlunatus parietis TaxID=682979 RepID=A0A7Y9LCB5_9ACTN|nr:alpha/beta fold hydrolase [Microlunatus parietis]NYE71535.1 pimeloyl-ACP methyl ester carboxylesterase [Microlunatus parietis]
MGIPEGATEEHLHVDGGRVRLLRGGQPDRPVLLLIHGGGTDNSAISWATVFPALAERWQPIAIDLPGFGGSSGIEPVGGPQELARFLIMVLDRLGIDQVIGFGVSMGGDVALNLALLAPDRVTGLVLIAPGGLTARIGSRFVHTAAWLGASLPDALLLPLARLAGRFTESALRAIVRHPDRLPRDLVDEFVREARRPGGGIAYGRYNQATIGRTGMINNLLPVVSTIAAPTLIVHGCDDPIVDPRGSISAAELMPAAQLIMIDDCGHWVQVEQPAQFLAAVLPWLHDRAQG